MKSTSDNKKEFNKGYGKPGAKSSKQSGYGKSGTKSSKQSGYGAKTQGTYKKPRIEKEKQLPNDPAEVAAILGRVSCYRIAKLTPIGAYISLASDTEDDTLKSAEILLPKNEFIGKELTRESLLNAFLYLDSEDRPVATLKTPALSIGELAVLSCTEATELGAFLDWGLMKDLFLPFKEQTYRVKKGDQVLVTLYLDKSSRLCASMKIYKLLKTDAPYVQNDHVDGLVYELSDEHGAYVAVDNKYSAMIPKRELVRSVKIGDRLQLRVSKVLADGKLELAMREQSHIQLNDDCTKIYEELKASKKGFLPYHDKTESLIIKNKFNMSKIAFKRAIGHLYKQGLIVIQEDGISLVP